MPNHVHLLITPATVVVVAATHDGVEVECEKNKDARVEVERNEFRSAALAPTAKLEAILKVIKGASAVDCNRVVGRNRRLLAGRQL